MVPDSVVGRFLWQGGIILVRSLLLFLVVWLNAKEPSVDHILLYSAVNYANNSTCLALLYFSLAAIPWFMMFDLVRWRVRHNRCVQETIIALTSTQMSRWVRIGALAACSHWWNLATTMYRQRSWPRVAPTHGRYRVGAWSIFFELWFGDGHTWISIDTRKNNQKSRRWSVSKVLGHVIKKIIRI